MDLLKQSQELKLENVLSLRKKVTQQQVQEEFAKMGEFIKQSGAKKNGSIATATFAIDNISGHQIIDIEILIPLDKEITAMGEYKFKPIIHMVNALYIRHQGHPKTLENTMNKLNDYIIQNKLQAITATYNVNITEPKTQQEIENMIIDVYIGINPSIL